MTLKDMAIAYAAIRVARVHIIDASEQYQDDHLEAATDELVKVENIFEDAFKMIEKEFTDERISNPEKSSEHSKGVINEIWSMRELYND